MTGNALNSEEIPSCERCGAFPFFGGVAPEECPFCSEDSAQRVARMGRRLERYKVAAENNIEQTRYMEVTPGIWENTCDFWIDGWRRAILEMVR